MATNEVLVDALPYIDMGYDETGIREAVLQMIEEETRRYKATKNYLEHLPPLNLQQFETDLLKVEFERLQNRQPMDMLNMKRYELPSPSAGKMTDVSSWNECVDNSLAQLEHQSIRITNLELTNKYGAEYWKTYNSVLLQIMQNSHKHLQELRKQIQEVNWQRKSSQITAGEELKRLETEWVSLVSKNYDIERTCTELEIQIKRLEERSNTISTEEQQQTDK